jgi:hypothetical protein
VHACNEKSLRYFIAWRLYAFPIAINKRCLRRKGRT